MKLVRQRTLEQITAIAHMAANDARRPMAVLNLNHFQPLYVIREWNDDFAGSRELVKRVCALPATIRSREQP
jgi:hypothetical protein